MRSELGSTVIELTIVLPLLVLLAWGGLAVGFQLIDGMLVKYGVYEEARRGAVGEGESGLLTLRSIMVTSSKNPMDVLAVTGKATKVDKDIRVEASYRRPRVLSALALPTSLFGLRLKMLELTTAQTKGSYSLPVENKDMYPKNFWEKLASWFGF